MLDITVVAPEEAGVSAVAGLKAELMSAMTKASPSSSIVFDISETRRVDSSLAQLIVALRAEAEARGLTVAIKGDDKDMSLNAMLACDALVSDTTIGRPAARRPKGGSS